MQGLLFDTDNWMPYFLLCLCYVCYFDHVTYVMFDTERMLFLTPDECYF